MKKIVIIIALASFMSILLFIMFPMKQEENNTRASMNLKQLKQKVPTVSSAEKAIQKANDEVQAAKLEKERRKDIPIHLRYRNSVIVGDSLPEALKDYGLLGSNQVLAIRGRRSDNCDQEIQQALSLSPQNIFMCYGLNDIAYYKKNIHSFIRAYEKQIKKIQKALPNTKIYVNSIIPMADFVYQRNATNTLDKQYNQELKTMCERLNITFIDNRQIMKWNTSVYESDGVHPKYPYYPMWLSHMAEIANM